MRTDISGAVNPAASLAPQQATAAVNGATVDVSIGGSAVVVVQTGAVGGTTPSFTVQIQDSPDGAVWTAVVNGDLRGTPLPAIDATQANKLFELGYMGSQPNVRVAITAVTGTTPTLFIAATVVRGHLRSLPG